MIFTDTGALFALSVENDESSTKARTWLKTNREPLVTTDYILDELLTLLRRRGEGHRAPHAGRRLFSGKLARLHFVTSEDVHAAWDIFQKYDDKEWSFTDCVSFVFIERLHIKKAFSFDEHFKQFGTITVVP